MADPVGPGVGAQYGASQVQAASARELMALAMGNAGQPGLTNASEPMVYMGPSYHSLQAQNTAGQATAQNRYNQYLGRQDAYWTMTQAQEEFFNLSQSDIDQLNEIGSAAVGYDISKNFQTQQTLWNSAITAAISMSTSTGKSVSPMEALKKVASRVAPKDPADEPYKGPITNTDLSNPDTARYVLDNALRSELGRAPNAQEESSFYSALLAHQRANPTVSVPNKVEGSGYTTTQGANEQAFAQEWAAGQDGAAEYRASGYADLLLRAIDNPDL